MLNKWSLLLSNLSLYGLIAQVNTDVLWKFCEISLNASNQKEGQLNSEMVELGRLMTEVPKSYRQKNVKTQTEGWLSRARIRHLVGRVRLGQKGSPGYQASKWPSYPVLVGPAGVLN